MPLPDRVRIENLERRVTRLERLMAHDDRIDRRAQQEIEGRIKIAEDEIETLKTRETAGTRQ